MIKKLFVLGSINIDLNITTPRIPEKGETIEGSDYFEFAGGKGANQAVAASGLGVNTYMIAKVGKDLHGENSIKNLNDFGVKTDFVEIDNKHSTGIAIIIKSNNDNRIILDPGANQSISLNLVDKALNQAESEDIFLTQLENPIEIVSQAIKKAKAKGLVTVFNPAPAKKIDSDLYKYIDYLVLNETETEILIGEYPKNKEEALIYGKKIIEKGVGACIITLGEKGSIYIDQSQHILTDARKVETVDSTGAGDSFIGAFVSGLYEKLHIKEIIERATIVSAFMCTIDGAQSNKLKKENIKF